MHASPPPASAGARLFTWLGAALFAAALGCFLFFYAYRYGQVAVGPVRAAAVISDVVLFTLFALHHSVFARERVRAMVARTVAPELERSFYVWVASLLFIAVCWGWRPVPGLLWRVDGPVTWLLLGLQLVGIWLTLLSAAAIDVLELAGLRPARNTGGAVEFKTTGPYGLVRHPIYTGWFLIVFPVAVMTNTRLVFAIVSSLYLLIAIPLEERSLRNSTAGAYDRYIKRVRWKLVPGLY